MTAPRTGHQENLFTRHREGLFSSYYLEERLALQPFWKRDGLEALHARLREILREYEKIRVDRSEENTRNGFVDPVLKALGYAYYREVGTRSGNPDYALFDSLKAKEEATPFFRKDKARFYGRALTILEAKYWDRPLENVVKEDLFSSSDASGQLVRYLNDLDVHTNGALQWGILTNGRKWRLFWHKARNRVSSFHEVDLEEAINNPHGQKPGSFDVFNRFVLFFEPAAFERDAESKTRLDDIASGSEAYALKVGDSIRAKVFDPEAGAFIRLARGFARQISDERGETITQAGLDEIFHGSMTLLYRLLFLLYAESRDLLPAHEKGYGRYALETICEKTGKVLGNYEYFKGATDLWQALRNLFKILDQGAKNLNVPQYNGGLFKGAKGDFFERFAIADVDLAPVLMDLTREGWEGGHSKKIDYQALGVRQLGSIYEGLLEFRLALADKELFAAERGGVETWVEELPPGGKPVGLVKAGQVYLVNDKRERRSSGSYYTPDFIVKELVKSAVRPAFQARCQTAKALFSEIHDLRKKHERARTTLSVRAAADARMDAESKLVDALFSLRVLDPAMGSGHFLVEVVDELSSSLVAFLASPEVKNLLDGKPEDAPRKLDQKDPENPLLEAIAKQREAILAAMAKQGVTVDASRLTDSNLIKRMVMKRCVYGVDLNPMAVELAKVSLWLDAFTLGAPLSFLDHHLKCGNSLVGSEPEAAQKALDGHVWINEFAAMLAATDTMRRVGEISDVTLEEVGRSLNLYEEAQKQTAPFKAQLDVFLSERFGVKGASQHLDAIEANPPSVAGGKKKKAPQIEPETRETIDKALAKAREVRFFHWSLEFPEAFYGAKGRLESPGFDAVVGNPPWERIKLQENEFFAQRSAAIAYAPTAAERKRRIAALEEQKSPLWWEYQSAKEASDALLSYVRECSDYPLMGKGDTNLYAVFVERAASLTNPKGRCALVVPSGIATDKTTSGFFRNVVEERRLGMLLDFENRNAHFPSIHRSFKYTLVSLGGARVKEDAIDCGFFLHGPEELQDPERRFTLTAEDFALFNPNTLTSPVFRTRRDAEITRKLYAVAPILIRHKTGKEPERNHWKCSFLRMFDMTNDSQLFRTREQLERDGFWLGAGNVFTKANEKYLPLYEGKMIQLYNHRAASVEVNPDNLQRPAQPRQTTQAEYRDPDHSPVPQFWLDEAEVASKLEKWKPSWLIGFKDICAPTNVRTFISAVLPMSAVGNKIPLILPSIGDLPHCSGLLANFASIPFDFITRQKVGGQTLNYFIVEQLPVFPPETYDRDFHGTRLLDVILPKVLELTYTAHDMAPFAKDMGYSGPPFAWDEERRLHLKCQLDALFFILYGLSREEADYVLSTFAILKRQDEAAFGHYRTKDLILAYMAAYASGDLDAWARG